MRLLKTLGLVLLILLGSAAIIGVANRKALGEMIRGYAVAEAAALKAYPLPQDPAARGAAYFTLYDFGGLNTDSLRTVATPWKVTTAALLMADGGALDTARLPAIFNRYGFVTPSEIANWPQGSAAPKIDSPLGLTRGVAERGLPHLEIEIGNLGCAACHTAVAYDAAGRPDPKRAYIGSPNTSIDLEAYTQAIYGAIRTALKDEAALLAAVQILYPETSVAEMTTLRRFVLPEAKKRIRQLEAEGQGPLPFSNGAPGVTNGVAALKMQNALLPAGAQEHGFTAVPELADRQWRTALLYDGAYAPKDRERFSPMTPADLTREHRDDLADIVTFFTVPSMGVKPEAAHQTLPQGRDVMAFLSGHRPQPFPGKIDQALAATGATIFAAQCSGCHGDYAETPDGPRLTAFPNWNGEVGTDPARAAAMDDTLAKRVNASAYSDIFEAAHTGAYAAPPLTGLWASAPYLHNASVPSLAQFLGLEPRAARFQAGGHALDFSTVGLAYPSGYTPWSQPAWIDTAHPGYSNKGHEAEFGGLTDADKRALIEYLKRL